MSDTSTALLVAVLTPRGRGAVASLRLLGDIDLLDQAPLPMLQAANGRPLAQQTCGRILFGRWGTDAPEDIVFCRVDDSAWEVHCHGGLSAVERIVKDCVSVGAKVVSWQDLLGHSADALTEEFQTALSQAVTWRTTELLLVQQNGLLRSAFEKLARIEWTTPGREQARTQLDELLKWSLFGQHLTEPWRIVLTGPPNVGKSSLMNALLGYGRSIVFDQPGTTRDVITAVTAFGGWPVELIDTAGLREASQALEAEGISRAKTAIAQADLVLQVIDIQSEPNRQLACDPRDILVAQKCDLPDRWGAALPWHAIKVSALTGTGLDALQTEIAQRLVPELPPEGTAIPFTARQRELLQKMRQALDENAELVYRAAAKGLIS